MKNQNKETPEETHKRLVAEATEGLQTLIEKARRENMFGIVGVELTIRDGRVVVWSDRRRRRRR